MLPATTCLRPAVSKTWAMRLVVVVLPLEPVTATMGPRQNQLATSISLTTGTPLARAVCTIPTVLGTPGLTTTSSAPESARSVWPPASNSTPEASSSSAASGARGPYSVRKTVGAAAREELRHGEAAARAADDGDAQAFDPLADRLDGGSGLGGGHHRTRKRKTVRMESSAVTIQKRITILLSWTPIAS